MIFAIAAVALLLAGCQEQKSEIVFNLPPGTTIDASRDLPTVSVMQSQERGGNSPSTLNPPITATVTDPNVQVNSATGDQTRSSSPQGDAPLPASSSAQRDRPL